MHKGSPFGRSRSDGSRLHYRAMDTGHVHLLPVDLWEAMTGERLSPNNICEIVESAMHSGSPVSPQSAPQAQYVLMAKDRTGSRVLQQKLEEGTDEEHKAIFSGLERDLKTLIVDPCANFVIQKLCDYLDEAQQNIMLVTLLADIDAIIDHTSGCRVLQKFIEVTTAANVDTIYVNVKPIFLKTCMSQNGNHIVQRFIDILPERIKEIAAAVKPHLLALAFDNCGCRVIQRLFDKYDVDTLSNLVDDVIVKAVDLSTNQYGNYVVQKILESGKPGLASKVISVLKGCYYEFSMHKFASNVMEKCIRKANPQEQMEIFTEIIGVDGSWEEDRILRMSKDQFGNYVVQRIIKHGNEEQREAIADVVYNNYDDLMACTYAKHVIIQLKNLGY